MTLSPEDRERIYEEEKARKEAQDRLKREEATAKKEVEKKNAKKAGVGCLLIIVALFVFVAIGTRKGRDELLEQTGVLCAPTPDEDGSTLYDTPPPPMPTRFLRWRARGVQAAFLYDHKTGGWHFLSFQTNDSKSPISISDAMESLCR